MCLLWLSFLGLMFISCNPFSCFSPKEPSLKHPIKISATKEYHPQDKVEILIDKMGVPHIYGNTETDLAYGLGFMHGRDRQFQIEIMRHTATGRLSEMFGTKTLKHDQKLRFLTFNLDEQYAALRKRDQKLLTNYASGVNDGVLHSGPTVQQTILQIKFAPFTAKESLAIARLMAWNLANDFQNELLREKISNLLPKKSPLKNLFFAAMPSGGVPIISNNEKHGNRPALITQEIISRQLNRDFANNNENVLKNNINTHSINTNTEAFSIGSWFKDGASNSWVVHGSKTKNNKPILCNDPHLDHSLPSSFYIAHLEHRDFTLAGGTIPGVLGVMIGHSRNASWGMTNSYADLQDLVKIKQNPNNEDEYLVDNKALPYQ